MTGTRPSFRLSHRRLCINVPTETEETLKNLPLLQQELPRLDLKTRNHHWSESSLTHAVRSHGDENHK